MVHKIKGLISISRLFFSVFFLIMAVFFASLGATGDKPTYTLADAKKLMAATLDEDVMGGGTDPDAILALLKHGQLVIIDEHAKNTKWLISGGILINTRPETLFGVITDAENYSNFMPMTEGAQMTPLGPNIVDLKLTLKIKIIKGIPAIPVTYSVIHYHRPPYRSDWTAHTGRFKRNDGFYQFVPVKNDNRTMAFYTVYSLPRIPLTTDLFKKDPNLELMINMSTAAMVTRALKKRAEHVEKRKPFMPGKGMGANVIDALTRDTKTVNLLLARGGLILIEDGPPMYATTAVAINAPPEVSYKIISDFENYPCYLSQIERTEVIERSEDAARVAFRLSIDYGIFEIPMEYELAYRLKPPHRIEWKWASGDLPSQLGSWTLAPIEGGKRTLGLLRQSVDLKTLPGLAGAGLRVSISGQPSLEPAIMGSQALITARSMRDFIHLSPEKKHAKTEECRKSR